MAIDNITPKNTIKSWFKRGLKPTELQFRVWMDSYWHKSEPIPTATIEGLENVLNSKAETADITSIRTGMEEHAKDNTRHKTAGEQGKLDNLADNPNLTYSTKSALETLETEMEENDIAGLQAAKEYTDILSNSVYKKTETYSRGETDNKYVFKTDMPVALKNPNAITFTGAVSGSYDGSVAKTVNIPAGLSLGESAATAYRGDRGKVAYDYAVGQRTIGEVSGLQSALNGKVDSTDSRLADSRPANGGTSAACSGNAATATKLQTARTINGVSFDGSANITISNSWNNVTGKPTFATVASSGNYNDLTNKPVIPTSETAATIMSKVNSQAEIIFTKYVVCTNGAGTASTSDMRFKNNVYNLRNLLPIVVDAPLFNYTWKDEPGILIGSSAQYWEQYLPELVYETTDGTKTLSYERLGGVVALKAIQELNEKLINEISRLTKEIDKLKNR